MNKIQISKEIQTTLKTLSEQMDEYVSFAKEAIKNPALVESLSTMIPFETRCSKTVPKGENQSWIKSMGIQLMSLDIEPETLNLGLTIDLKDDLANSKEVIIYVQACKTLEQIEEYISSTKFKEDALEYFRNAILKFYSDNMQ